ncbi:MAG TPA: MlaD family protein [Baekduia sp.]|jgi:virulence factor Mce-like protein|nr:MlaD family protein [Baekduia sp.]
MPPLRAGLLAIALIAVAAYFGFTKAIPFRHHYEIQAVVRSSNLLKPNSPVRIAGVNVGKVVQVGRYKNTNLAVVTLRIDDRGRPVHRDATAKIRPRLFLEGNFYVDLKPGTPEAGDLADRGLLPITQTSTPVQLDQVLTALQSDTRGSLQKAVQGFGQALDEKPSAAEDARQDPAVRGLSGAQALNKTLATSPASLRDTARVTGALLGPRPHDLSRTIHGLARTMTALADHQGDLADLIQDFNTTMATTASHAADLRASVAELGPTAQHAQAAFTELDASLPATRRFARDLSASLPALPASIAAAGPWLAQAQQLLSPSELGGLLNQLEPATTDLAALGHATRAWLPKIDAFNRCITKVIIPTGNIKVDDGALSANVENYKEFWYAMVGQAGEGQGFDGNGPYLRLQTTGGPSIIKSGKTNYSQEGFFSKPTLPPLTTRPAYGNKLPPLARSVPCASSPVPDVNGPASTGPADGSMPDAAPPSAAAVDSGGGN